MKIIAAERQSGRFRDINDFARRVDIRKAGKRALESLIRVGALDCFGERRSLLEGLENVSAISESHFKAKDTGQLTFFGNIAGLEEEIRLPKIPPLDAREKLEMERELLGLYLSDNPLNAYLPALRKSVTHYTGQLRDTVHQSKVVVGGRVLSHRTTTTKKGQEMAFAVLEDLQGTVEMVIFPKAWQKSKELIRNNEVVLVKGKLDNSQADAEKSETENPDAEKEKKFRDSPKVLVDSMESSARSSRRTRPRQNCCLKTSWGSACLLIRTLKPNLSCRTTMSPITASMTKKARHMRRHHAEKPAAAPEPKIDTAADQSMAASASVVMETAIDVTGLAGTFIAEPAPVVVMETQMDPQPALQVPQGPTLVVSLVSCGSKERDNRRLKQIHGVLTSVPGADHFAFLCKENGRSFRLDFPNERTAISDSLLRELRGMLGDVNVAVEE